MANKQPKVIYENNPFYIGLNGLKLLFANAQSVAIYAIVLSVIAFIVNLISNVIDAVNAINEKPGESMQPMINTAQQAPVEMSALLIGGIIVASILFVFFVLFAWAYGILEYTGARLALGEKVTLKQAIREVAKQLASYLFVLVLVFVKIFLWSLLLIVPGIIMAVRYSLATTVFFAEGKHGNAAIKRSLELTKGAWLTTFAGSGLWNLITFSQITALLQPGVNAVLYRQLKDTTDNNETKPTAHWLSWTTLLVPLAFIVLLLVVLVIAIIAFSLLR